jgi:hypothetical protein
MHQKQPAARVATSLFCVELIYSDPFSTQPQFKVSTIITENPEAGGMGKGEGVNGKPNYLRLGKMVVMNRQILAVINGQVFSRSKGIREGGSIFGLKV